MVVVSAEDNVGQTSGNSSIVGPRRSKMIAITYASGEAVT